MVRPLYLIPARGGSKGVPGKNIRLLGGMPLISHTISTALNVAGNREDVVVSTDSEEIAAIAEKAGAIVPFMRPAALATDQAGSREVMLHAVDSQALREREYDTIVLLQPTSPFRNEEDIKRAIEIYESKRPDMVVTVREAASNPYYNAYETDAEGKLHISKGDGLIIRRQDAPPVWEFDGSVYVINVESLRKYPSLGKMPVILPVKNTSPYNIDIDTELDFLIAETIMSRKA